MAPAATSTLALAAAGRGLTVSVRERGRVRSPCLRLAQPGRSNQSSPRLGLERDYSSYAYRTCLASSGSCSGGRGPTRSRLSLALILLTALGQRHGLVPDPDRGPPGDRDLHDRRDAMIVASFALGSPIQFITLTTGGMAEPTSSPDVDAYARQDDRRRRAQAAARGCRLAPNSARPFLAPFLGLAAAGSRSGSGAPARQRGRWRCVAIATSVVMFFAIAYQRDIRTTDRLARVATSAPVSHYVIVPALLLLSAALALMDSESRDRAGPRWPAVAGRGRRQHHRGDRDLLYQGEPEVRDSQLRTSPSKRPRANARPGAAAKRRWRFRPRPGTQRLHAMRQIPESLEGPAPVEALAQMTTEDDSDSRRCTRHAPRDRGPGPREDLPPPRPTASTRSRSVPCTRSARASSTSCTPCATSPSTSAGGEFFGIVGRNGSGKSTLLKCLAEIYRADSGRDPDGRPAGAVHRARRRLQPRADGARQRGDQRRDDGPDAAARRSERFDEVIEFAELEEFVDLKLKNYSSGMQVRLAFSVMIQSDADVLLIDEVLAVGDAAFQQKCVDVFYRDARGGTTIVLVTHYMGDGRALLPPRDAARTTATVDAIGDPGEVARQLPGAELRPPDERRGEGGERSSRRGRSSTSGPRARRGRAEHQRRAGRGAASRRRARDPQRPVDGPSFGFAADQRRRGRASPGSAGLDDGPGRSWSRPGSRVTVTARHRQPARRRALLPPLLGQPRAEGAGTALYVHNAIDFVVYGGRQQSRRDGRHRAPDRGRSSRRASEE